MDQSAKSHRIACAVASTRPWNKNMASHLQARTGNHFELITDPGDLSIQRLKLLNPQYIFFPHWSHRIEAAVFNRFECVIFHMTDLPFGRGGSPLQNLIAQGLYETQITALKCTEEMDAGPVYLKRPLSLHGAAEEIYLRASTLIEDMIVDILESRRKPVPQQGEPTLFKRRKPEQGNLAKAQTLREAFDLIRMLDADGYPRSFLEIGPFRLEFTRAALKTDYLSADVRISLLNPKK